MKASGSEVLSMIEDGGKLDAIETVTLWDRADIMEVARDEGYALDAASGRFRPAPKSKPAPTGIVRHTPPDVPASSPVRPATRDLIEEGRASSVTKVKRAAAKAQAALDHLAAALAETREAEAARQREAEERRKAQAEVDRLAAELEAARAKLRAPRAKTPATSATTGNAAAVRAWAAANGVDCPSRGIVPRSVVEQYDAAMAGAA